ncbi:hypothetical protein AZF37_02110 [endosymbiont 'TC1' of Trimyema compressum]|uniref:hypothetical protein n=1 Tax=endosymbiont 'TC1' of Trimyema compressum TaxID=243899 RepID=UPI0007F15709|nr:hypothetical protein [endosymbiont 'TC1' of Trimyema compressum]AMP20130.1 hypothetical protein AZF37_02110 [endosymbiont 'TC1' of Trimyema compressum]
MPIYDASSMSSGGGMPKVLGKVEEDIEVAGILNYSLIDKYIKDNKDVKNVDPNDYISAQQKADGIVLPNTILKSLLDKESVESEKIGAQKNADIEKGKYSVVPVYTLKDYKDLEKFTEMVRTIIPSDNIQAKSASDSYAQVAKPL